MPADAGTDAGSADAGARADAGATSSSSGSTDAGDVPDDDVDTLSGGGCRTSASRDASTAATVLFGALAFAVARRRRRD